MIFSSYQFIIFFLIFIFLIKNFQSYQRQIILIFSIFFYSYWNPVFIFLIIFYCIMGYILIKKEIKLSYSIILIICPLIYFKYSYIFFNLFYTNKTNPFIYTGELPLAISFITFTILAVIIDIKKKIFLDKLNLQSFSEFILYFPQLIAGPILRAKELIPKLNKKISFNLGNIKFGLILFLIGFVKKIFLADNIGIFIDPYFESPNLYTSKDLIKAFFLFPIQIYFDFSGYVDMALGISATLGIYLPINFNKPYLSYSLTEFWRNWHITLSNWFRDYLYIPLGGSRVGSMRRNLNLVLTMSLAGLWHGASFNFILWGFLNGIILSFEKKILILNKKNLFRLVLNCFIVFNLWVIFRIEKLIFIKYFYLNLYKNIGEIFNIFNLLIFLSIIFFVWVQKYENHKYISSISRKLSLNIIIPIFFVFLLTGFGISLGQSEKFIYFNF